MRSVELFVGAGGLGMGISRAGFKPQVVLEWDKDACDTIRANQRRGIEPVADWPLVEFDVVRYDYSGLKTEPALVAGGPPCQPFSLGGKHRGHEDERNMYPEAIRAVRELRPQAFLFENVRGLARGSFSKYFEYIKLQLTYPEITRREGADWTDHLARLERHRSDRGHHQGLSYRVQSGLANAADYGVPQRRERVFIVGFRHDLDLEWSLPDPTHTEDALLWSQWGTGEYWDRNDVPLRQRPAMSPRVASRLARLRSSLIPPQERPWATVRDAISGLPDPERPGAQRGAADHLYIPGARSYPGHTGSPLDEPAKTLKAGVHGVPGGENMLRMPDGRVRYFTVRESARLQTFPDEYQFSGAWGETMRQLGNAVPVELSEAIASSIAKRLSESPDRSALTTVAA